MYAFRPTSIKMFSKQIVRENAWCSTHPYSKQSIQPTTHPPSPMYAKAININNTHTHQRIKSTIFCLTKYTKLFMFLLSINLIRNKHGVCVCVCFAPRSFTWINFTEKSTASGIYNLNILKFISILILLVKIKIWFN